MGVPGGKSAARAVEAAAIRALVGLRVALLSVADGVGGRGWGGGVTSARARVRGNPRRPFFCLFAAAATPCTAARSFSPPAGTGPASMGS